jgi:arylsulfatase A-like enzyme
MKVLVITARGLRADYLGCYGNPRVETPALDALATRGIVFDRHFADAADPEGACQAWRTGRYVFPGADLPAANVDLVRWLTDHDIRTTVVIDDSRRLRTGLKRGWKRENSVLPAPDGTPLERTIDIAKSMVQRFHRTEPSLVWVDLATALPPWDVPADFAGHYFRDEVIEEEDEDDEAEAVEVEPLTPLPDPALGPIDPEDDTLYLRIQGSYSGAITYLDAGIAELLRGVGDDVLVVVTSDVGFALGEHGVVGPGLSWPAEAVSQLPMILRLPGGAEAGYRVPALTQAVDLASTLAVAFGVPFPETHGRDLAPLIRGETDAVRPYAVSWNVSDGHSGMALRTPEWSLVLPAAAPGETTPRLYVRPDDHWEVNDVRQHHLELTEALEKTLRDFDQATRQPGPFVVPPLPEPTPAEPTPG